MLLSPKLRKVLAARIFDIRQFVVLEYLAGLTSRKINMRDVAKAVDAPIPAAHRAISALKIAGLVERRQDDDDRRKVQVWITDAGADLIKKVRAA